jgi:AcrR family transcriptional regulator
MPATASERGATTRERLLRAAAELIPELGWGGVTTRKVAARAGVRPGVVHYHFVSVSDLLSQTAVHVAREALAESFRALDSAPDVASGLDHLLATIDSYTHDDPAALVLTESFLAATRDETLRLQLRDLFDEFRGQLAAWLRRHAAGTDTDATAAVLAAALDGVFLHRALDPSLSATPLRAPFERLVAAPAHKQETR